MSVPHTPRAIDVVNTVKTGCLKEEKRPKIVMIQHNLEHVSSALSSINILSLQYMYMINVRFVAVGGCSKRN